MNMVGRNTSVQFKRAISIAALLFAALSWTQAPMMSAQTPVRAAAVDLSAKFIKVYPGQYMEREKALLAKFLADNKAISDRGPVDVQALIHGTLPKDTPGIAGKIDVTEAMVRYNNQKYDPDNKVLNDAEYAKKLGYENIQAYPTFAACDDLIMAPYPNAARDTLLVSQLNHNITIYKPVYPGDTIYTVLNSRTMVDVTPVEGSYYRSVIIISQASLYNQKGEKVNDATFRVTESLKFYKEGLAPKNPGFMDIWEAPAWMARPAHKYTDKDWETIKSLWAKEKRQGATPLYWEDVKIGDQPAWTVDGPILKSIEPVKPYGMGIGGSRTMKKEIMDPVLFKTMVRDEKTGIYHLADESAYIPPVPDQKPKEETAAAAAAPAAKGEINTKDIHKQTESRAALINFFGRDVAIRSIHNWMGDKGVITNIRWGIMEAETHAMNGKIVPKSPYSEDFLSHVPSMKGKHITAHGLTTDLAITKSYVYNKYVKDGQYCVDVAWWVESIDGDIWEAGGVTVALPSKNAIN